MSTLQLGKYTQSILRNVTSNPGSDLSGLVTREVLLAVTEDVRRSLSQRQDVLLTSHRALETLTVDLLVVMGQCLLLCVLMRGSGHTDRMEDENCKIKCEV